MSNLEKQAYELCLEIEKLPASENQTKLAIMASDLLQKIRAAQQGVQADKCPACDGKGWFGAQFCEGEECPTCEGTGICR